MAEMTCVEMTRVRFNLSLFRLIRIRLNLGIVKQARIRKNKLGIGKLFDRFLIYKGCYVLNLQIPSKILESVFSARYIGVDLSTKINKQNLLGR